jgi:hypothetical protein
MATPMKGNMLAISGGEISCPLPQAPFQWPLVLSTMEPLSPFGMISGIWVSLN